MAHFDDAHHTNSTQVLRKDSTLELGCDRQFVLNSVRIDGCSIQYASKELLKNDHEIILEAVKNCVESLNYISNEIKENLELIYKIININFISVQYLSNNIENICEIELATVSSIKLELTESVNKGNIKNINKIIKELENNNRIWKYVSKHFKNDSEFMFLAVSVWPSILLYASKKIQNNYKIVLKAVKQNGHAFHYASINLRNNYDIVYEAIKYNGLLLFSVSKELQNNYDIVYLAVQNDSNAIQYASDELKNNYEIVYEAVKQNALLLEYASVELQNNYEIVYEAVKKNGLSLQYASTELKNNYNIVYEAAKQNWVSLTFVSNLEIKYDRKIVLIAIRTTGLALEHCSEELKNDYEIAYEAIKQNPKSWYFISEKLKKNRQLFIFTIKKDSTIFYQSGYEEFRKDYEVILYTIVKDIDLLKYALVPKHKLIEYIKNYYYYLYSSPKKSFYMFLLCIMFDHRGYQKQPQQQAIKEKVKLQNENINNNDIDILNHKPNNYISKNKNKNHLMKLNKMGTYVRSAFLRNVSEYAGVRVGEISWWNQIKEVVIRLENDTSLISGGD